MKKNTFKAYKNTEVQVIRGPFKGRTGVVKNGRWIHDSDVLLNLPIRPLVELSNGVRTCIPESYLAAK